MDPITVVVAGGIIVAPLYVYVCGVVVEKLSANHVATQKTTVALLGNAQELQDKVSK